MQEIHENFIDDAIQFIHTPSKHNVGEILTREYFKGPEELPWANYSVPICDEGNRAVTHINVANLPDANPREIPVKVTQFVGQRLGPWSASGSADQLSSSSSSSTHRTVLPSTVSMLM